MKNTLPFFFLVIIIASCAPTKFQTTFPCDCYDDDSFIHGNGCGVNKNRQKAKYDAFFEAERQMLSKFSHGYSVTTIGDTIIDETVSYKMSECPLFMENITYEVECEKTYYKKGEYRCIICLKTPKPTHREIGFENELKFREAALKYFNTLDSIPLTKESDTTLNR